MVTAAADFTGFSASAAATRPTIYLRNVPTDGSLPPSSKLEPNLHQRAGPWFEPALLRQDDRRRKPGRGATPSRSGQRLGFVLVNVTGGMASYPNGATNSYGGANGSTHTFYTQLSPPSLVAYPSVTQNCTVQTAVIAGSQMPAAPTSCTSSLPQYATPTCAQIGSQQVRYFWNDMGGNPDDYERQIRDAEYTFTCSGAVAGSGPSRVALIK